MMAKLSATSSPIVPSPNKFDVLPVDEPELPSTVHSKNIPIFTPTSREKPKERLKPSKPRPLSPVIEEQEEEEAETRHNFQRRNKGQNVTPDMALWVAQRLAEESPERAKAILAVWTNAKRSAEVTEETIAQINRLSDEEAVAALKELRRPKQFIRGIGQQQMDVPVIVQTLEDGTSISAKGLLDSGCTGSCIDCKFMEKHNLQTKKAARPVPVYNADRILNKNGDIEEYVELRITVQDHEEKMIFGVTDLGKSDLFIGYDWLKHHNPDIVISPTYIHLGEVLGSLQLVNKLPD